MSLFHKIRKVYPIKIICSNCCKKCEVNIRKGVSVSEAMRDKEIKCDFCGCWISTNTYETEWEIK